MMTRSLCFSVSFFILYLGSDAQWTSIDLGPDQVVSNITMAGPTKTLAACGGQLFGSIDGGDTWNGWTPQLVAGIPLVAITQEMIFQNEITGFIAGSLDFNNAYYIGRSTDGGQIWPATFTADDGAYPRTFYDIQFLSPANGFAGGTNGLLVRSVDGGATWTLMTSGTTEVIRNIHFSSLSTGLLVLGESILRTVNGGANWSEVATGEELRGVSVSADGTYFVAGDQMLLQSTDEGATWTTTVAPIGGVRELRAITDDLILVATAGGLFITHNGGLWWETPPPPVNANTWDMTVNANGDLLVSAANGTVFRTTPPYRGGPVVDTQVTRSPFCGYTEIHLDAEGDPSLSYSWTLNDEVVANTMDASIMVTQSASTGEVELQASNGIHTTNSTSTVSLFVFPEFEIDAGVAQSICPGSNGTISATGAPATAAYAWAPSAGLSSPNASTTSVTWPTEQVFTVTATNGPCASTDSVTLTPLSTVQNMAFTEVLTAPLPINDLEVLNVNSIHVLHEPTGTSSYLWSADAGATLHEETFISRYNFSMFDPCNGVAYIGAGINVHTSDAWRTVTMDTLEWYGEASHGCTFLNPMVGFCIRSHFLDQRHELIRTIDGGLNWNVIMDTIPNQQRDFAHISADTIYFAFVRNGSELHFSRTTDGGSSWSDTILFNGPGNYLYSNMAFGNGRSGHIHKNGRDNHFKTSDGGITWQQYSIPQLPGFAQLHSLTMMGDTTAFFHYGDVLYRNSHGGRCWQAVGTVPGMSAEEFRILDNGVLFMERYGNTVHRSDLSAHAPELSFSIDCAICDGELPTMNNGSFGHDSYMWSINDAPAGTGIQPSWNAPPDEGTYSISLIATLDGISDTITHELQVASPQSIIDQSGSTQITINEPLDLYVELSGSDEIGTVTWLHDGSVVPGATEPILHVPSADPSDAGVYLCRILTACGTLWSQPIVADVSVSSMDPDSAFAPILFPNPTSGMVTIRPTNNQVQTFTVHDATGKVLEQIMIHGPYQLDMTRFAAGLYSILVCDINGRRYRVTVQKT